MFFKVEAKCGHVGRNKYVLKKFYIEAETPKEAAYQIRVWPRVKHHQKDAIKSVREITYEEFMEGLKKNKKDKYFQIHNSSDQKRILEEDILDEPKVEMKKTREVSFKLKKTRLLVLEAKKMIMGAYYG